MKKSALVIGIDNYPNWPLKGSINDATAVAGLLSTHFDGSPNFNVRLATDITFKSELKKLIFGLFRSRCDIALFYFAGHGLPSPFGNYLVTPDCNDQYDIGVSMDDVLYAANKSEAKHKVIILDCCYSGCFGSPNILGAGLSYLSEGVSIITSSRKTEKSTELDGQGIFSKFLLRALNGGAADLTGDITIGSIYSYIDKSLGPHQQRATFKNNVTEFVSLRKSNPQIPLDTIRKIIHYFPAEDHIQVFDHSFRNLILENEKNENELVLQDLQQFEKAGLIADLSNDQSVLTEKPRSSKLTPLGIFIWHLVKTAKV